ncbi:MAG TPA: hypothetical protein VM450_16035, partial [Thermomicrobiales bacterium]|nr:hypothetical protein [Thermomicrobiales bacterium]
ADERIQHPKQVVHEGQELILRIIRIDPQRRRMGLSLRRALDTPDAELEAVFGEGILAERDALAQQIRQSLEAEGLTGTRQDEAPADAGTDAVAAQAEPIDSEAAAQAAGEAQVAAFEERRRRAEEAAQRRQDRSRGQQRQQSDSGSSFDSGDEMSAMAMAFAMAGAPEELLTDVLADDSGNRRRSNKRSKARDEEPAAEVEVTEKEAVQDVTPPDEESGE